MRLCVPNTFSLDSQNHVRLTMAIEARKLLYIDKVTYDMGALIEVAASFNLSSTSPSSSRHAAHRLLPR